MRFQLLKGKHGRSDEAIHGGFDVTCEFQLLKGKHGRSDFDLTHYGGRSIVSTPQRKTRPFRQIQRNRMWSSIKGFNSSKENTAVPTHNVQAACDKSVGFQLLKGKHGRSDNPTPRERKILIMFQLLKGKHGRSDTRITIRLKQQGLVSTPQRKTRPFRPRDWFWQGDANPVSTPQRKTRPFRRTYIEWELCASMFQLLKGKHGRSDKQ